MSQSSLDKIDNKSTTTSPKVLVLYPYLLGSTWVFDDKRTGLKAEAFVLGTSEMITRVVESKPIPNAQKGFKISFSDQPFDGYDGKLDWIRSDGHSGNWYAGDVVDQPMENWLCPALLLYFVDPPKHIFVRCDPLPENVNPIWNPSGHEEGRRFVEAPQFKSPE